MINHAPQGIIIRLFLSFLSEYCYLIRVLNEIVARNRTLKKTSL
ncbi:hypothetical protein HMPREF0653_01861 [Prevotella disiens JCM 6334 = ATCC 29426]|uniref:Uncharacterized protein n=1 Tax=Prevotella disiens JCM 6334 = ATCC 29426 TaxID=1235811 RepID=A0ABN0NQU7_9BACT|nr:hypothetical protein HMPREF0653_01861 [Prevotella disiens JCM 6334 = ATCC 29426]